MIVVNGFMQKKTTKDQHVWYLKIHTYIKASHTHHTNTIETIAVSS